MLVRTQLTILVDFKVHFINTSNRFCITGILLDKDIYGFYFLWEIKQELILFTNPSAQAGYDSRSIFKRSLTGLNSEFSFTKAE